MSADHLPCVDRLCPAIPGEAEEVVIRAADRAELRPHDALLDLRTPATPSWLIWTPSPTPPRRSPAAASLSPQRRHFSNRLLLSLMRDKLAVVAAPVAKRNGPAEISASRLLVGLHLADAFANPIALRLGEAAAMVKNSLLMPSPEMSSPRSSRRSETPRLRMPSTTVRASRAERTGDRASGRSPRRPSRAWRTARRRRNAYHTSKSVNGIVPFTDLSLRSLSAGKAAYARNSEEQGPEQGGNGTR